MKVLKVSDMRCEMCVKRINKAFGEEKLPCQVDLGNKTVSVEEGQITKAFEILEDLGFTAEEQ